MSARHALNVCFHGIGEPVRTLELGEDRYWIAPDQYLSILDSLVGRDVRISFDDGNLSDVLIGLPGLVDRGLTATFFVLAGRLGQTGSLDADHVAQLQANGMRIGTHGMDHRPWAGLEGPDRRRELVDARNILRATTGDEISEAALPLGRYDRELLRDLRGLGYTAVFTSDRRWARSGAWLQPRFSVRREDTAESLWRAVLARPSVPVRIKREAVGVIKRWR